MAQSQDLAFSHLLYIGIVAILLLVVAIVVFVVVHQHRAYLLQSQLRQQELTHRTNMLNAVIASQESERERIARDLHDEIGASLSAVRLFVNQVHHEAADLHLREMTQQASQILGDTLQNVRHIAQNLSPMQLTNFGFCRAVAAQARSLEASGVRVALRLDEAVEELGASAQLALYRIVQEMLANVSRHAQARSVTLALQASEHALTLSALDDGRGFLSDQADSPAGAGMGLAGMRARAQLLGGHLTVTSALGHGTHVTLLVPR